MFNNVALLASFYLLLINYIRAEDMYETNGRSSENVILSRKKRYLVFPDGTSLQLVYCFTVPVEGYPTLWTFGITYSTAWLLPTKPEELRETKKSEERIDRPTTTLVNYIDTVKKTADKNKYTPFYANNYMPFYSHQDYYDEWRRPYYQQSDRRTHTYNRSRDQKNKLQNRKVSYKQDEYSKHPLYTKLHRISRRDLYNKLEQFFFAQRKDGRACLLKVICDVSKSSQHSRGTFMEEIIKTTFRIIPSQEDDEKDEYDSAANKEHDCDEMYPTCVDS